MAEQNRYVIRVTPHHSIVVEAANSDAALCAAWLSIADGYTYGYKDIYEFIGGAKIESAEVCNA